MIEFQFIELPPFDLGHVEDWFHKVVQSEEKLLGDMAIVIGSDDWLLEKNKTFLEHDYYTDIITFDYCAHNIVSGDLLVSLDRVHDNADSLNVSRETELNRVLVHGLLHLCGYGDKTEQEVELMRSKEDYYLTML